MNLPLPRYALAFGELLWDELPTGRVLGGAPGNFAYRLSTLGIPTYLVSRIGADSLGDSALSAIQEHGVAADLVQRDPQHPTGTVKVALDSIGTPTYTIIEQVAYDFIEPSALLLEKASKATLFCYGSLSQRTATSRETLSKLLESASGALKFFDVNLRKNCFSTAVLNQSLKACNIAKLNHEEIAHLAELFSLKGSTLEEQSQSLLEKFNLDIVLITMAERGAFATSSQGSPVYAPGYRVNVIDTIGSGDAFSAAFCHTLLNSGGVRDACELGNKLGALVAKTKGAMSSVSAQELAGFGPGEPRVSEPSLERFNLASSSGASAQASI